MSDLVAIPIIDAIALLAYFAILAVERTTHERCEIILHGVSSGMLVSLKHRRLLITQSYIPQTLGSFAITLIVALGFIGAGLRIDDLFVQTLSYICAVFYGVSSLAFLTFGPLYASYLFSVVREVERSETGSGRSSSIP